MKTKAVVLVSGGMDSCVTAAIAAEKHTLAFLHLNYGQRTEKREAQAFHAIADHYQVKERLEVDARFFNTIGGSSLTDPNIPVKQADLEFEGIPDSYVPFRNANILAIATSYAEVIGAAHIYIGAVEEDSSGYPDCREAFYEAYNKVIDIGTRPETRIRIETPLIHMKKAEIIQKGMALEAPLHLSWSCYQDSEIACGVCDSCALRLRGFAAAGLEDPIPYRIRPDYDSSGG
ncbi:MAG: 7-cyano-7-deazaguanine synthase QueC [Calditrichaeota bacterium]|nr:MAG: 7-cyano-7-deazaguanine synthase QueC [Calditrichota bacterium]